MVTSNMFYVLFGFLNAICVLGHQGFEIHSADVEGEKLCSDENVFHIQQEQIDFLMRKVSELSAGFQQQKTEIIQLKNENQNLIRALSDIEKMFQSSRRKDGHSKLKYENGFKKSSLQHVQEDGESAKATERKGISKIRKERLLLPLPTTRSPPASKDVIAFYAYMTGDSIDPGASRTLIFDKIITNAGNGYHNATGAFIAPRTGIYVFSWSMRLVNSAYHQAELVHNHNVMGVAYLYAPTGDHTVSGTVVIHVNQGDDVFIRTQSGANSGNIESGPGGRTSFSGWKLS
ncbi:uncharacterized protein LOC134278568 [Saccostrea cucullata]|uniref:uncharacterized protein LOC134278568 n=1 Tax=Saccostrea cuccullata TaxID=36930 RepID=UPI002ED16D4F